MPELDDGRHLMREIRNSELDLRVNKDHPVFTSIEQMLNDRLGGDIGMTAMVNFGNIAGLTLSYKLSQLVGTVNGVRTLWVPDTLPGPGSLNYMVQRFDLANGASQDEGEPR